MANEEFKPFDPEVRHKEIDLIQSVITRMADNQFKVKGFCVIILGFFLFGLQNEIACLQGFIASFVALLGCYFLDLRYLQTEKLFRIWFDFLQRKRSETKEWLYLLNPISIKTILSEQNIKSSEFNIEEMERNAKKGWSLKIFYLTLFLIICIFYLKRAF